MSPVAGSRLGPRCSSRHTNCHYILGCLTCRKKKIKCPGGYPCAHCQSRKMECVSGFEKNFRHYQPTKHKREDSFNQHDTKKIKQETEKNDNMEGIVTYNSNEDPQVKLESSTSSTPSRVTDMAIQEPGPSSQLATHLQSQNMPFFSPPSNYLTMEEINNIINQTHGRVQFANSDRRTRHMAESSHPTLSTETSDSTFGIVPFIIPVETYSNPQTQGRVGTRENDGGCNSESGEDGTNP